MHLIPGRSEGVEMGRLDSWLRVLQRPRPVWESTCRTCTTIKHVRCALQAHDGRNFTAVWVFKPKQRTFRVHRQFDVISNAMTNRGNAFVMVPPAEGYESALYSAELVPCKKVKFDAATLAPPAAELDPPQPQTPPRESTVKVGVQTPPVP